MTHLTAADIMDRSEATLSPDLDIYLALTQRGRPCLDIVRLRSL